MVTAGGLQLPSSSIALEFYSVSPSVTSTRLYTSRDKFSLIEVAQQSIPNKTAGEQWRDRDTFAFPRRDRPQPRLHGVLDAEPGDTQTSNPPLARGGVQGESGTAPCPQAGSGTAMRL